MSGRFARARCWCVGLLSAGLLLPAHAQNPASPDEAKLLALASDADADGDAGTEAPQAPSAPALGASVPAAARRAPLVWRLEVEAPEPLDKLLSSYLDLARFEREREQDQTLRISRNELRRLVISAPEQARGLLEAQGYFASRITTRVSDAQGDQPVIVTLHVEPGPRTHISQVQFVYEGELDNRVGRQEAYAQSLVKAVEHDWALPAGEVFTQAAWTSAKNAALAQLRARGYPTASWSGTSATVDAEQHTARLFLVADSGPAFRFGDIRVEGLKRQPASAVTNLAPFKPGDPYEEKKVLDWQERIQKLNLFDNLFVSTDLDPTQADASPVVVQLRELPMQAATTGIGVSSDTGPRVSAEYLHRQIFDLGWQAKTTVQLGRQDSHGQLDLTSHPWSGRRRGLISAQASYLLDSDHSEATSQRVRVGLLHEGERLERTDYVEFQRARVQSRDNVVVSDARAYSYTTQFIWRDVDNQILPLRGTTTLAQLGGGRSYSALDETGYFGRAYAR
ncbi:MAG TPA: POTRA domain-containing protein, partial [Aquabacterium sp.]|nr:POTRA domain-containing protein [Aquabacterium sp.]